MGELLMPVLGADMEHGTVREWMISPGDTVRRGQIVAVVETEKADIEIEVFEAGTIAELLVPVGVEVPVGTPIARVSVDNRESTATAPTPAAPTPAAPIPEGAATTPAVPRIVSPMVRHLAEELQVDVASIQATGAGGRVLRSDIERAAPARATSAARGPVGEPAARRPRVSPRARRSASRHGVPLDEIVGASAGGPVTGADVDRWLAAPSSAPPARDRDEMARQAVGRLMARSKREIPHYYLGHDVDVEDALRALEAANERRPVAERVLPAALLLHAVARAVPAVPEVNGQMVEDRFVPSTAVNLGVAVSTRAGGLVAPVVRDADQLSLGDLMAALRALVGRVRSGSLRASDVERATITVTSLGEQGTDSVVGVITPPQVAVVGIGRIVPRPWVREGSLTVRRIVHVTLAADHRVTHGHRGALFLRALAHILENPEVDQ